MARDIDQLIDAAGRRMLCDAPPMPALLERAVQSRRRAIMVRRAGLVTACLAVAAGGMWGLMTFMPTRPGVLPGHPTRSPMTITADVADEPDGARAPTLGSFRAATRLGAAGAERATDRPEPSMPAEVARPFMGREIPELQR